LQAVILNLPAGNEGHVLSRYRLSQMLCWCIMRLWKIFPNSSCTA